uniref:Uncharacterized protein n=1 Tax=viral metagenome TaxID=1070528 RepID=A0A6C0EK86_9ZZZZ
MSFVKNLAISAGFGFLIFVLTAFMRSNIKHGAVAGLLVFIVLLIVLSVYGSKKST